MIKTLAHLFTPGPSNNYKAKSLHISSLSAFMLIIMFSQLAFSFIGKTIPGVLGLTSTITSEELINLTNKERRDNGLQELQSNPVLVDAATKKAADMINKNYWAHTSPEGKTPWSFFKEANYQYLYAGENLARDFLDSGSVVKAWMDSPTHRDNILSSRYRDIGIVVVHDTFQGQETTLVVQMFGTTTKTALAQSGNIGQTAEAVLAEITSDQPSISSFTLTKSMSISLTLILLLVIALDSLIIAHKKIIRLSGRGLAHLIFLGILLLLLIVIQPGLVL